MSELAILPALPLSYPCASSPALPLQSGSALVCCPGEVQELLSQVWKPVRGRNSSPILMTPEPPLLPAIGGKGRGRGGMNLSFACGTRLVVILSQLPVQAPQHLSSGCLKLAPCLRPPEWPHENVSGSLLPVACGPRQSSSAWEPVQACAGPDRWFSQACFFF